MAGPTIAVMGRGLGTGFFLVESWGAVGEVARWLAGLLTGWVAGGAVRCWRACGLVGGTVRGAVAEAGMGWGASLLI